METKRHELRKQIRDLGKISNLKSRSLSVTQDSESGGEETVEGNSGDPTQGRPKTKSPSPRSTGWQRAVGSEVMCPAGMPEPSDQA